MDKDYEQGKVDARAFAKQAALDTANGDKAYAATLLEEYDNYATRYTNDVAGSEYTDSTDAPPAFISVYAAARGKQPTYYDPRLIERKYKQSMESVENGGRRPEDTDKYGISQYFSKGSVYSEYYEQKLGTARRVADTLKKYTSPEYRRLVDPSESVSFEDIKKVSKQHDDYNRYLIRKLASGESWKLGAPGEQLASIGADIDPLAVNRIGVQLDRLYYDFTNDTKNLSTWSDAYKSRRAKYIAAQDKVYAQPGGEFLRDGPAGRLLVTYLTKGSGGNSPDKRYVESVTTAFLKDTDPAAAFNRWIDAKFGVAKSRLSFDKDLAAFSWTTTLTLAVKLRRQMMNTYNESMESKRITPTSNAGEKFMEKLKRCVILSKDVSPRFRRQWEEAGGDDLIESMLSYSY